MSSTSQTIPDYITMLSGKTTSGGQVITDSAVCEDPLQFGDSPQQIGLKGAIVEFLVTEAFAGMAEGFYFQLRADIDATLDNTQIIVATSPLLQTTDLTLGDVIVVPIPAFVLPSTFEFFGAFYLKHTNVATAGIVIATIKLGGESVVV